MKVPLGWLREFVDVPVDVGRLAEDLTLAGLAVDAVAGKGDEAVLELDVTTNRVDCMNVYGVAREVSVLYNTPLRPLPTDAPEAGPPASEAWTIDVEAPELCPRFCGRVLDVRLGPSPAWMRDRLEAVGVRPINNVVDLTNYVMMEMGHPSHAFDLGRLPEARIVVRWSRAGETVTTLDGQERTLGARVGVIGGTRGALALAGIMGGASTEVSDSTRAVALEAAYWDPATIRRGAKALGMHTEASHRFERGADPEGPPAALGRIAHLLARIGAGTARPGLIDRYVARRTPTRVALRPARVTAVLGAPVAVSESRRILSGLGFAVGEPAEAWPVEVPTWRGDVTREVDLVEEVARHHGLGRIPSTIPASTRVEGLRPAQRRDRDLRSALAGAGLTEVVTYAFVPDQPESTLSPRRLRLANPLSAEQAVLRDSLVFPGLVGVLRTNLRQGRRDVAVFELGRVFGLDQVPAAQTGPEEPRLGFLLAGRAPAHLAPSGRAYDFFDAKGLLELLAARFGVGAPRLLPPPARWQGVLHPGQSALLEPLDPGRPPEILGVLHPDLVARWELKEAPIVAELDPARFDRRAPVRFRALARFPAVERDLAVVAETAVPAVEVLDEVTRAAGPLLREVRVVDRYDRPPVPAGRVSLTVALAYQDPARTLTGEEVQSSVDAVVGALRARGWDIRGE
ncbi:MAG TPA: phenylalanine--tRNA ligase subunit beta [Vicinamibacteria bacterium]|nr:phenylalanine--tRNA ligase subunit beta [Vicinamibacteria bacterium]